MAKNLRPNTASPGKQGFRLRQKEEELTEQQRNHELRKQQLEEKERQMMASYEKLKKNLEKMNANQQQMMRMQEVR